MPNSSCSLLTVIQLKAKQLRAATMLLFYFLIPSQVGRSELTVTSSSDDVDRDGRRNVHKF